MNDDNGGPKKTIVDALVDDDDLAMVVRAQLFIEYAVEQLIAKVTGPDSRPLFSFMDFNRKIDAGRSLGVIETSDVTALQKVAWLRNQFAHNLHRVLTVEDDQRMCKGMKCEYRKTYDAIADLKSGRRYGKPGFGVQTALTTVFRILSDRDPQRQAIKQAIADYEAGLRPKRLSE